MNILKNINKYRRRLTQKITRNLGSSSLSNRYDPENLPEINKILVCRPNHRLGNLILITPIIQEIRATFPNAKIDLFVKGGLAPIVFQNYTNIDTFIELPKKPFKQLFKYIRTWFLIRKKKYDLAFNVTSTSSSGRLATKFSKSTFKIFGDENDDLASENIAFQHIAKHPVYNFRECIKFLGYDRNENKTPSLDLKLDEQEIQDAKKTLYDLVSNQKETICIFTFATGNKCYSESWWASLYESLKSKYKNYNIVEVLPVENISQIGFKAPSFYSKDIREICAFIANTKIFIGADSGIMHLASASLTPTIGLFIVDKSIKKYHPYSNGSMAFNTNEKPISDCFRALNEILLNT